MKRVAASASRHLQGKESAINPIQTASMSVKTTTAAARIEIVVPAHIASPPLDIRVRAPTDTMRRATVFLAANIMGPPDASMLANSLRELDRFLNVLIDAVVVDAMPLTFDRSAFARRSNTPNKLRDIHRALGLASPDHEQLRAIGRARERLFHAARLARSGRRLPGQIALSRDLAAICGLYGRIAEELAAASRGTSPLH